MVLRPILGGPALLASSDPLRRCRAATGVHAGFGPMHRRNRGFSDAALVLFALSIGIGPLTGLVRAAVPLLPLRRKIGIFGCLQVPVPAAIIWVGCGGI